MEESSHNDSIDNNLGLSMLIIGAYVTPPYVEPCFMSYPGDKTCYPGVEFMLIYELLSQIGLPLTVKAFEGYNATFAALKENQIDITGATDIYFKAHLEYSWPTLPIVPDYPIFVMHRQRNDNAEFKRPFGASVSISIGLLLWVLLLMGFSYDNFCDYIMGVQLDSYSKIYPSNYISFRQWQSQNRVAAGSFLWSLTLFVLGVVIFTQANVIAIAQAVQKRKQADFNDYAKLESSILSGQCILLIYQDIIDDFGKDSLFKKLLTMKNKLIFNNNQIDDVASLLTNDSSHCYVAADYRTRGTVYASKYSDLKVFDYRNFPSKRYVYYYRKSLPRAVATLIEKTFAAGSLSKFYDIITRRELTRVGYFLNDEANVSHDFEPFDLSDMARLFELVAYGALCSVIVFCTEVVTERLRELYRIRKYRRRRERQVH